VVDSVGGHDPEAEWYKFLAAHPEFKDIHEVDKFWFDARQGVHGRKLPTGNYALCIPINAESVRLLEDATVHIHASPQRCFDAEKVWLKFFQSIYPTLNKLVVQNDLEGLPGVHGAQAGEEDAA
jgi:hypothetical protein